MKHGFLTVGLGNTLELVLLADGVAVGGSLGSVDNLISEALSHALDVTEGSLASTSGDQGNTKVNTTKGRNINSLTTDSTSITNTGRIFTRPSVNNSINDNLDGVSISEQVDDLHGLLHDTDSQELLTVVTAVHHEAVGHAFDDGALGLAETLGSETTGRVGEEDATTELDVVLEGDVVALDTVKGPLSVQLDVRLVNLVRVGDWQSGGYQRVKREVSIMLIYHVGGSMMMDGREANGNDRCAYPFERG